MRREIEGSLNHHIIGEICLNDLCLTILGDDVIPVIDLIALRPK